MRVLQKATAGINALNAGFTQLSAYNDTLLSGASQLKANAPALVEGVTTLQGGTAHATAGLGQLGSQLSDGSAKTFLQTAEA